MKHKSIDFPTIDMYEVDKCLIVPMQTDLYDDFFNYLEKTILQRINMVSVIGVVLDISALKIIDSINIQNIINLCEMTKLMGKQTVIIGVQPAVASVLTDFSEIELKRLNTFIDLKKAIHYLINTKKKYKKGKKLATEKMKP